MEFQSILKTVDKKTLFFDFDGTIAGTIEPGVVIFNELAERHGFKKITLENAEFLRGKGPREVMKDLAIPTLKAPFILKQLRSGLRKEISSLSPTMPGIKEVIFGLKQDGYMLGIVTSNSEDNVKAFLIKNEMDIFDYIWAGSGIFRKKAAIKKAIASRGFLKSDVIFVGDEIRDVEAAKKNGIKVIAVTWGTNSREGLARAKPDYIVDTTQELLAILA